MIVVRAGARGAAVSCQGCGTEAFRGQVTGVPGRCQRRTARLAGQVEAVVRALAGRAGSRLLAVPGIGLSGRTALRALLRMALPGFEVPRVLGIDGFALRKGLACATILIDAGTGRRAGVLEGRTAGVAEEWLRAHPGVEAVARDGSGAYAEAVRSALPLDHGGRGHPWVLWMG